VTSTCEASRDFQFASCISGIAISWQLSVIASGDRSYLDRALLEIRGIRAESRLTSTAVLGHMNILPPSKHWLALGYCWYECSYMAIVTNT
jgi:hypothetical protein